MLIMESKNRKKVLFLCTGNSCRSQMAEAWVRILMGDKIDAYSAGTKPQTVNPFAIKVMSEVGVDISKNESKHLDSLKNVVFDLVFAVCDNAASQCPILPEGTRVVHAPFEDPPELAKNAETVEEALSHYRKIRDEIKEFILQLPSYNLTSY
jgi:arsenate reductase